MQFANKWRQHLAAEAADADILAPVQHLLADYVWARAPLALARHAERPCPWLRAADAADDLGDVDGRRVFWSLQAHDGSVDDEWFAAFLASSLTSAFPVRRRRRGRSRHRRRRGRRHRPCAQELLS